jgi:hypothetical protein
MQLCICSTSLVENGLLGGLLVARAGRVLGKGETLHAELLLQPADLKEFMFGQRNDWHINCFYWWLDVRAPAGV